MMDKTIMTLHDIVSTDQFADFYAQNGLTTVAEKIDRLKKVMKIRAMRCDEDETPEEILEGLEESCLLGYWKGSW